MSEQNITTGSNTRTVRFPSEPEFRVDRKCLCVSSDFSDAEAVAMHIVGCILGQTVTDANLPRILKALDLYKERGQVRP